MSLQAIEQYITAQLPNITKLESFGYTFYFYGTDQVLPFVTFAASDNEQDNVSHLNRDGVFRVNIGVSKNTYNELFKDVKTEWDYTILNSFLPHPHYAAQHFICILNPEGNQLLDTFRFIEEAHLVARQRFERKQSARH
jgi:hypothetical protein